MATLPLWDIMTHRTDRPLALFVPAAPPSGGDDAVGRLRG